LSRKARILLGSAFVDPIRGIKLAFISGVAWLIGLWLLLGDRIVGALGTQCGAATSAACGAKQSPVVHLVVLIVDAFGPIVTTGVLAIVATVVGGTANFLFACGAALLFLLRGKKRKTDPSVVIDLLMGWATPTDLLEQAEWQRELEEAQRVRGEGATRLTASPALLLIAVTLAIRLSPWYWFGVAFVAAIAAHGFVAMIRSESMYRDIERKARAQ